MTSGPEMHRTQGLDHRQVINRKRPIVAPLAVANSNL